MTLLFLLLACDLGSDPADGSGQDSGYLDEYGENGGGDDSEDDLGGQEGEEAEDTSEDVSSSAQLEAPETITFETETIGCSTQVDVSITNTGTDATTVSALELSGAAVEFSLPEEDLLPVSLQPGATVQVPLSYAPVDATPDVVALQIFADDPTTPAASTALVAEGVAFDYGDAFFIADGTTLRFPLDTDAVEATISVSSDSVLLSPEDWTFSDGGVLLNVPPVAGAAIDINYVIPPPDCL